jgi:FkbM family methyltransferase
VALVAMPSESFFRPSTARTVRLQPVPNIPQLLKNVRKHIEWGIRDRFPNRKVVREVQGVTMVLPWPHRLPDYAGTDGPYGQNLVNLAKLLSDAEAPVHVLDVGANVGDSTLQILDAADARVLCIEADPYYLEYLHLNVDSHDEVEVVEALLTPDAQTGATTAVRVGGTTRFTEGGTGDALGAISVSDLRTQHPDFADMRLVKSDTDGYDVVLVPALARAWADSRPVLFFEYDPVLTRMAGNDPDAVWPELASLGYRDIAVWGNGGHAVGRTTVEEISGKTAPLEEKIGLRKAAYWDVAVVHEKDDVALAALDKLVPGSQRL